MTIFKSRIDPDRSTAFEKFLPTEEDRVAIVGKTGSGKSTFAFWLMSEAANFHQMPWVIVDYKGEVFADRLLKDELAKLVHAKDDPPTQAGLFVLRPSPHEQALVAEWLWRVWKRGRTGLLFDELYMVPEFKGTAGTGGPLKSILTQGRSKKIPVYGLSQRPVDVNLHMFSEAQYFAMFRLTKQADRERVLDYIPDEDKIFQDTSNIPLRWCKWHDDKHDFSAKLSPCPPPEVILDTFERRVYEMEKRRKL